LEVCSRKNRCMSRRGNQCCIASSGKGGCGQPEESTPRSGEGLRWPDDEADATQRRHRRDNNGDPCHAFAKRMSEGTNITSSSQCSTLFIPACVRGCINTLSNWRTIGTRGSFASHYRCIRITSKRERKRLRTKLWCIFCWIYTLK